MSSSEFDPKSNVDPRLGGTLRSSISSHVGDCHIHAANAFVNLTDIGLICKGKEGEALAFLIMPRKLPNISCAIRNAQGLVARIVSGPPPPLR